MAAVEKITSPVLKKILADGRRSFNTLFATAKHFYPRIEAEIFSHYLKHIVEPVVIALEKGKNTVQAGRGVLDSSRQNENFIQGSTGITSLVFHLYERLLELLGKGLLGSRGRYPYFDEAFTKMVCGLPHMMLQKPDRFTGAVSNAVANITAAAGGNVLEWVNIMLGIGRHTTGLDEFLEAGKVAAWRCGLAHYRVGALEICDKLAPDLIKTALNIPGDVDLSAAVPVSRLKEDPWFEPGNAGKPPDKSRLIIRRSGAFSGFGGPFITPPQVRSGRRGFVVQDAERYFIFFADIFGSVLLPLRQEEYEEEVAAAGENTEPGFKLMPGGVLEYRGNTYTLPRLANASSFALNRHTFCFTVPLSHSLFFGPTTWPGD